MLKSKQNCLRFFLITFLWSWSLLAIPVLMHWSFEQPITKVLFAAAGISPSATGIILVLSGKDSEYRRSFFRRIVNFRQIGTAWYLFMLAYIPVTSVVAAGINFLFTRELPDMQKLQDFVINPLSLLGFAVYMLLFGPVAEEIGWRGYALDQLATSYSWLKSSMIVASFWFIWHLPMFFIEGTYQQTLIGRSFLPFVDFGVAIFASSIIMGWIYYNNRGSILSAILLHFFTNFFGEISDLPDNAMYWRTAVQVLFAIFLIAVLYRGSKSNFKLES